MRTIKLSPSSLTFLYDECKRCFYLSINRDFKRPSSPMPKIFTKIDNAMKNHFMGKSNKEIDPDFPEGSMIMAQKRVMSQVMHFPNHELQPYFSGLFDAILEFTEGGYGLIDFKTSDFTPQQLPFYQRQLAAYVYAMENPAPNELHLAPIKQMGLVYFSPDELIPYDNEHLSLKGKTHWKEIARDDEGFVKFIDEVLTVLELPEPPEPGEDCAFCKYRDESRVNGY